MVDLPKEMKRMESPPTEQKCIQHRYHSNVFYGNFRIKKGIQWVTFFGLLWCNEWDDCRCLLSITIWENFWVWFGNETRLASVLYAVHLRTVGGVNESIVLRRNECSGTDVMRRSAPEINVFSTDIFLAYITAEWVEVWAIQARHVTNHECNVISQDSPKKLWEPLCFTSKPFWRFTSKPCLTFYLNTAVRAHDWLHTVQYG